MIQPIVRWVFGGSRVERLLLAATVVATLRMMLIHGVFIGFDLSAWAWFGPVEVFSGLAFAVLEGKALAYVSKLWVGLKPESRREVFYWWLLLAGQGLLLLSIVGVTAFAAASVRRSTGIDDLLGDAGAVAWSMFVTGLNPLMVMLIGIARAVDPEEEVKIITTRKSITWLGAEDQARIFIVRWKGEPLTPPRLIREFEKAAGIVLSAEEAERYLLAAQSGAGKRKAPVNGKEKI